MLDCCHHGDRTGRLTGQDACDELGSLRAFQLWTRENSTDYTPSQTLLVDDRWGDFMPGESAGECWSPMNVPFVAGEWAGQDDGTVGTTPLLQEFVMVTSGENVMMRDPKRRDDDLDGSTNGRRSP